MSAFTEFLLVALVIFLWESALWLPLRVTALRKRWRGNRWRAVEPGRLMATKELGVLPLLPLPSDGRLAPCQSLPLMACGADGFTIEPKEGEFRVRRELMWDAIKEESHALVVDGVKCRISSPRALQHFRRGKRMGLSPAEAAARAWRLSLSPVRAGREWRKWRMLSEPLRWFCPVLAVGFFVGLPLAYVFKGTAAAIGLALWLWFVMWIIAARVWWLGKRAYPTAKGAFRMDAFLCALVPFHAMRAAEICAVHAMAATHPWAMLVFFRDFENPWLAGFARKILHPRPEVVGDEAYGGALRPMLETTLASVERTLVGFDHPPELAAEPDADRYCPRCHSVFSLGVSKCSDCKGIAVLCVACDRQLDGDVTDK